MGNFDYLRGECEFPLSGGDSRIVALRAAAATQTEALRAIRAEIDRATDLALRLGDQTATIALVLNLAMNRIDNLALKALGAEQEAR